jgi:hypothetical protein
MDEGYWLVDGTSELAMPEGWTLFKFWQDYEPSKGPMHRPECKVEGWEGRVAEGSKSWHAFTNHARHQYALGQKVILDVPVGTPMIARAKSLCWSSKGVDIHVSQDGSYYTQMGIDTKGGDDPNDPDIKWSYIGEWTWGIREHDKWTDHVVKFKATGKVTFWLRGYAEWALQNNNSWWDAAYITVEGEQPPEEPPDDEPVYGAHVSYAVDCPVFDTEVASHVAQFEKILRSVMVTEEK